MKVLSIEASPWRAARWLVMAPHPDDETLGVGALIHQAAATGRLTGVAFLNDGGGSHDGVAVCLRSVRRREAAIALRRLSEVPMRVDWLGWKDSHPHAAGTPSFELTARRLAAIIRARRVCALAVSDPGDRHCDHVAAFALAQAACARARRKVQLFTYSVWNNRACNGAMIRTRAMPEGARRRALAAHRSQLSGRMGEGFRLPKSMRRMSGSDRLTAVDWPR